MIATSLALALGVSVASGASTCTSSTGAPSICLDGGDVSTGVGSTPNFGITWNGNSPSLDTYKPTHSNSTNGDFSFYLEDGGSQNISIKTQDNGYKAQVYGYTTLTFNNNGKTIKMGDNGTATLGVGGGNGKTVTLDFGTVNQSTNYALQGNLFLGAWGSGKVIGTFGGKGISGNLTIKNGNNTLTFNNGANIAGNVVISGGTTTFLGLSDFTTANSNKTIIDITNQTGVTVNFGNESTKVSNFTATFNSHAIGSVGIAKNAIIELNFKNTSNTLVGNIHSEEGAYMSAEIKANFHGTGNNKIQGTIKASGAGAKNTLTFYSGANTIQGNIEGGGSSYGSGSINIINFKSGTGANSIIGDLSINGGGNTNAKTEITSEGTSLTIQGSITSQENSLTKITATSGTNNAILATNQNAITSKGARSQIQLGGSDKAEIKGKISAELSLLVGDHAPSNDITLSASNSNLIEGEIFASHGANTIKFVSNNATNTITGNLSSSGGSNSIAFGDETHIQVDGNFQGNITSTGGSNAITSKKKLTLGSSSVKTSISSYSGGTNGENSINANEIEAYISSMEAGKSDSWGSYNNTIEATSGNISIDSISSTHYIGNPNASGTIKNNIALGNGVLTLGSITATGGTNTITLENGTSTITGDLTANAGSNVLSLAGTTNSIAGNITSSGGSNSISFGNSSSTPPQTQVNGSITGNITASGGSNSITATGNLTIGNSNSSITASRGTNTISASGEANIQGNIQSTGGSNKLTLSGNTNTLGTSGTNTILASENGINQITATNLTINSSIITGTNSGVGDGGLQGKNLIKISGSTTFSDNNSIIRSGNRTNSNTEKYNIIKFAGDVSGSIAELTAVTRNSNLTNTKNVLSFDNLSSATTLTITDINKSDSIGSFSTGYNYIGKALTTGSADNGSLALNFTEENWSQTTYQASNLTLDITGSIYAKHGKNYINVGALSGTANIDGNAGTNNIATANEFQARAITARWNGANNIIIGGDATISGNITAGGSDNDGTNNLTFNKTSGTHSITGNLIANNGSNNLTFAGGTLNTLSLGASSKLSIGGSGNNTFNIQEDTKITSDLTAERTGGSGKNIFKISNDKSLTFADANTPSTAKTLTTNSGETEIVFLGDSGSSSTGTLAGNVTTNNTGVTTFKFSNNNGTYGITGTLSTSGAGQNIIDVSTNNVTISNDLTFSGSGVTGEGGNIINIGAGKILTLNSGGAKTINTSNGATAINFNGTTGTLAGNVATTNGTTAINFTDNGTYTLNGTFTADNSGSNIFDLSDKNATISTDLNFAGNATSGSGGNIINIGAGKTLTLNSGGAKTINTSNGATAINFNGATGVLAGNVATTGGTTTFNLGSTDGASGTVVATINGNITNSAINTFNINSSSVTLKYGSGLAFSSGTNNINFENSDNATLNWQASSGGENKDISTTAGNTNINFNLGLGKLASGISTTNGTTTIKLSDNASGIISGNISTSGGNTNITFADGSGSKTLSLLGETNTLSAINVGDSSGASTSNTLILSANTTTNVTNDVSVGADDDLSINFNATTFSLNQGNGTLTSSGNTNLNFISGVSTFTGNLGVASNGKIAINIGEKGSKGVQALFSKALNSNGGSGSIDVVFKGAAPNASSDNPDAFKKEFNELVLSSGGDNTITTLTSEAGNATIKTQGATNLSVTGATTLQANSAFNFGFEGDGASTINLGSSKITVGEGQGIGISLGGNGEKKVLGDISFTQGSTLAVNFNPIEEGKSVKATLGNNSGKGFVIGEGSRSIINLHGGKGTSELVGGITLEGGESIINFYGNTSLGKIALNSGSNTINIKPNVVATVDVSDIKNVTNTINLENATTLSLGSNADQYLSSSQHPLTINVNGDSKIQGGIRVNGGESSINLEGNADITKGLDISNGNTTINFLSNSTLDGAIHITGGNTAIELNGNEGIFAQAFELSHASAQVTFNLSDGSSLVFEDLFSNQAGEATFEVEGLASIYGTPMSNGGKTTINLSGELTLENGIRHNSGESTLNFLGSNNTLVIKESSSLSTVANSSSQARSLSSTPTYGKNNTITFYHSQRNIKDGFKTLSIGSKASKNSGIVGEGLKFVVYATSNATPQNSDVYADKIIIHSANNIDATTQKNKQTHHSLAVEFQRDKQGNVIDLSGISYKEGDKNNILLATVAKESNVIFNQAEQSVVDFNMVDLTYVTQATDEKGGNTNTDYISYYLSKAEVKDIVAAEQEITATAFTLNYDLYMANFNSLNKRMGELRENAHSQGVWARVFNGALSNNFGLGSKSNYTTIQAGYDYAFGFEGANNYLGVALSYALSTSTSEKAFDVNGEQRGISGIYSNAVEVAIYNSYVSDMGWYNDSIAKFSYIMSSFDIDNLNTGSSTKNNTNNFALTFGDEVGYVFKLGESKEWSITPQVELTFGYFNQSDFKQTLANSMAYLASSADAVLTLRSRVGSSFAYDFKNFTQDKGINASVYVGAFYEYDYVSGGSITMSTNQMSERENTLSNLQSDGRVVMNVGTNMTIKDNTRIYFDFEKSFAGKITTDYQVNVGVRYSFGESNGYTPMIEKAEFKAPLKVESESEEEVEEEANKESEANTTEQSDAENKVEEKKDSKEESKEGKEVSKAR